MSLRGIKEVSERSHMIVALRRFSEHGGPDLFDYKYERPGYTPESRGDRLIAGALAEYLSGVPGDEDPDGGYMGISWYNDLPRYTVEAFDAFRTQAMWGKLRERYLKECVRDIPDLVNIHIQPMDRLLVAGAVSRLLTCIASNSPTYKAHVIWLQQSLDETFHAQALVVGQTWHRFVRKCYREIAPIIKKESTRGRSGKFGTTTLMSYAMAGRVMYTFKRGDEDLTFVADESDMQGFRAGPNASITPYLDCVSMINEVVEKWDLKKMKVSDKVGLG